MIDLEGDHLVFYTSPRSRKARNLAADDRLAISVTDRDNLVRSALVRGRVALCGATAPGYTANAASESSGRDSELDVDPVAATCP